MSMEPGTRFRGITRLKPRLSPYDALPPSRDSDLAGGVPIVPIRITKRNSHNLIRFSKLALDCYNRNQEGSDVDASYEFHDLVKCTYWFDNRCCAHLPEGGSRHRRSPTKYYITFQAKAKAKAKGDPSSSPAITTFQAKISIDEDKIPVVQECRIKI